MPDRARNQVVILHGWSDTSDSFVPLANFLKTRGFQVLDLFLADYISMDDDVSIEDAAKAMQAAVAAKIAGGELKPPFDLIVHSTGGLVSRTWLAAYCCGMPPAQMPVQRLVMIAPANFGSKLADVGQTILGRVVKGWDHGFHTGKLMLNGLALGSPFQWDLAARDLFALDERDGATVYGADLVWPFVVVGSMPYQHGLRQMVNENGSDGTVRVAAANLNAYGATLDFTRDKAPTVMRMTGSASVAAAQGALIPWKRRCDDGMQFPLAVMARRDHASITDPTVSGDNETAAEQAQFQACLLDALGCPSYAQYQGLQQAWRAISDAVQNASSADEDHHMHLQINVRVVDEYEKPVTDYMIEFLAPNYAQNTDLTGMFHDKVIKDVHRNAEDASVRTIYVDRQRMFELFYARIPADQAKELRLSVSAASPGDNVKYFADAFGGKGEFVVHSEDEADRWLQRNATHFLKIVIPRVPSADVFKLKHPQEPADPRANPMQPSIGLG
jgi:pimeloyl-ACP methyl ester carboxylesterase